MLINLFEQIYLVISRCRRCLKIPPKKYCSKILWCISFWSDLIWCGNSGNQTKTMTFWAGFVSFTFVWGWFLFNGKDKSDNLWWFLKNSVGWCLKQRITNKKVRRKDKKTTRFSLCESDTVNKPIHCRCVCMCTFVAAYCFWLYWTLFMILRRKI